MFVCRSGERLQQPYERYSQGSPIGFSYRTFAFQMHPPFIS